MFPVTYTAPALMDHSEKTPLFVKVQSEIIVLSALLYNAAPITVLLKTQFITLALSQLNDKKPALSKLQFSTVPEPEK